jgi:hypothetical protein
MASLPVSDGIDSWHSTGRIGTHFCQTKKGDNKRVPVTFQGGMWFT